MFSIYNQVMSNFNIGLGLFAFCLLFKPFRKFAGLIVGWILTIIGTIAVAVLVILSACSGGLVGMGKYLREGH